MPEQQIEEIQEHWNQVYTMAHAVDPDEYFHWPSLLMGFLLAKGLPVEDANAIVIRAPKNGWDV